MTVIGQRYLQKAALGAYTVPEILNRTDKIGFGTPGDEWMQTDSWRKLTAESYRELTGVFPEIFKQNADLPSKGFDRWKVNQLRTWNHIFRD